MSVVSEDAVLILPPATVIWLNGPSSSGTSSMARALLALLKDAGVAHVDSDAFEPLAERGDGGLFLNPIQCHFLRAITAHLATGGSAMVDYLFFDHLRALEVMTWFAADRLYCIELGCRFLCSRNASATAVTGASTRPAIRPP